MPEKTFANDLVAIPKNKVIFMLNKTAYVVMRILDMNKVLMYEYHNDYIKINVVTVKYYYSLIQAVWCV